MKFLFNIAAKNLSRNKLRTSVSIGAIVFAVAIVVVLRGMILGILDSMLFLHVQYNSGHIKIIDQTYQQKERLLSLNHPVDGFNGEGAQTMLTEIEKIPGITGVMPRLKFGVGTSHDEELVGMLGWGVNPSAELAHTDLKKYLVEGRMVSEGKKEVVLGTRILEKLNLKVGEKITLIFTTSFGSLQGKTFEIVGKIDSKLKLLDEMVLFIPLDQAQKMLEMPDMVTELLVMTPDYNNVKSAFTNIQEYFHEKDITKRYHIFTWDRANGFIRYVSVARQIYNLIYVMIILLSSFVVINTMIMIVKERTKEIGMMTSLGLNKNDVLRMFMMEGLVMGLVGSFFGAILGGFGTIILSNVGIDYSEALAEFSGDILMRPILYPVFTLENLIFSFCLGVLVTTVASIIPARKAARLQPTEALRG